MTGAPVRLATQIAQGLHHVFGHREPRALAFTATLTNLGSSIVDTILPVLFIRQPLPRVGRHRVSVFPEPHCTPVVRSGLTNTTTSGSSPTRSQPDRSYSRTASGALGEVRSQLRH
ncbi:hypothetical protein Aros01_03022 [Streptosporangium roseum]